jgi:phosphoglycolate phosphatase
MISNVLFDLDGTLTDPKEGIIKCIQYAFNQLGKPYPSESDLANLIGPPLHSSFERLLHSQDDALIGEAVRFYRERFSEVGLFENNVYPGITDLLAELHRNSLRLYVVTVKPKSFADRIVRHFSLDQWLSGVYGSTLNGREYTKVKLVESVLGDFNSVPENTVIVGDRREDIIAGKSNGIKTIGVTYGYGNKEEITNSSPDYICHNTYEIGLAITKSSE